MVDRHDIYALDAADLHGLRGDVANLSDSELRLPTRCDGWTVEDLIQHMSADHEAILNLFSDPLALARCSHRLRHHRGRLDRSLRARNRFTSNGFRTEVGNVGSHSIGVEREFMDMLVHRLDLADARGQPIHIPDEWISVALGVARAIPPDSPLRDPTSPAYSYAAPVPVHADASALDAAPLGRNRNS